MKKNRLFGMAALLLSGAMLFTGCGSSATTDGGAQDASESAAAESVADTAAAEDDAQAADAETEIQVFIAASLSDVMNELAESFTVANPDVKITFNADSSGTLLQQIENGFACDIFFSAAQKQMNTLEEDGLVVEGTRANVVNNQVCVITYKGSNTSVTGLADIGNASSIALADGSVPVGKYTRQALVNMGVLEEAEDVSAITTAEVSEALGGVEISEQSNVSKVRSAVEEGSCEVGTVYYSDTYGHTDQLDILEMVSYDLTGDVIYPICMVTNDEADDAETAAAQAFYEYVLSDEAKAVFDTYQFDTNVER